MLWLRQVSGNRALSRIQELHKFIAVKQPPGSTLELNQEKTRCTPRAITLKPRYDNAAHQNRIFQWIGPEWNTIHQPHKNVKGLKKDSLTP